MIMRSEIDQVRSGRGAARRVVVSTAALLLTAGAVAGATTPASAAPPACWDSVWTDLDGGGPDVVVGLPSYDVGGLADAGAIVVFSNVAAEGEADPKAPTATKLLTANDFEGLSAQAGARFGAAVTRVGDQLDDVDHCANLMVGAPGQKVGTVAGAGEVYQLRVSATGWGEVDQVWNENSLGVGGGAQTGAGFGAAIAVSTSSLVAIGVPGRDVGGAADAGRVIRFDYRLVGPPVISVVQQGDDGSDQPEAGDRFGEVLDTFDSGEGTFLVVGVPHEDVGTRTDAGAVALMPADGPLSLVHQDSAGAGGVAEAGDRYGTAIAAYNSFGDDGPLIGVTIGVPGEDVGRLADAGSVAFADLDLGEVGDKDDTTPLRGVSRTLTQDSAGIPGRAEAGDLFGNAVLAGEFGHESGHIDLVVTAPLEDLSGEQNAGSLAMAEFAVDGTLLPNNRPVSWSQDSPSVAGVAERGDRFGTAATAIELTRLEDDEDSVWAQNLVVVPREDVNGVVDAGTAYLGYAPGAKSVPLSLPVLQRGAGLDMAPMR